MASSTTARSIVQGRGQGLEEATIHVNPHPMTEVSLLLTANCDVNANAVSSSSSSSSSYLMAGSLKADTRVHARFRLHYCASIQIDDSDTGYCLNRAKKLMVQEAVSKLKVVKDANCRMEWNEME